jgi:dTDP-4-dehydrorhamnose reductase
MIVLIGATGYIGQAFAAELVRRQLEFLAPFRKELDCTRFEQVVSWLRKKRPEFVINAAGFTGKPNVDACESARAETLHGNVLLPAVVAHACSVLDIPWGHVSSGCIYDGAKVSTGGRARIERDLTQPELRELFARDPEALAGFTEDDTPNFSFANPPCSFYSGTKALAEQAISGVGRSFIWRLRNPFDEADGPRNYLSKLQRYPKLNDNINSLSHRGEFVRACLELWATRAPFGIYNVTNPGAVSTRDVVARIERILKPEKRFEFWANDQEFYDKGVKAPRSNCILYSKKLLGAGVKMLSVGEALEVALQNWVGGSN